MHTLCLLVHNVWLTLSQPKDVCIRAHFVSTVCMLSMVLSQPAFNKERRGNFGVRPTALPPQIFVIKCWGLPKG